MYFALRAAVVSTLSAAFFVAEVRAAEKPRVTVNAVISIVRAGLHPKPDDKKTAKALAGLVLSERLEAVVLEHLESEGAGPRTLQELDRLAETSAGLAPPSPPPPFPHPPLPARDEMTAAIRHARLYAAGYAANLPNFLCNENIIRYEDFRGHGDWTKRDTLELRLSYDNHEERDKLVSVNGRPTIL